ncbi:hypothetical protein LJR220_002089 [Bradyrhizobium sp. LjRoot220]|uniref:hypothetical protein n=1 Tax=Bradyrhizobium sp. LjRoot220 TaxID=3342284 RepID=UPI003ECF5546
MFHHSITHKSITRKSTLLTIALGLSAIGSTLMPAAANAFGPGGYRHYDTHRPHAPTQSGRPTNKPTQAGSNWGGYGGNGGPIRVPGSVPGSTGASSGRPGPVWVPPGGGTQAGNGTSTTPCGAKWCGGGGTKPRPDKDCGIFGHLPGCGSSQSSGNWPNKGPSQGGGYPPGGGYPGTPPSGGNGNTYPSGGNTYPGGHRPDRYPPIIVERPPVVVQAPPVYVRPQPVVVQAPPTYVRPQPVVMAAPAAPAPAAAPAPCTCLTKEYQTDGSVVFRDLCTREAAVATAADLQAQAQATAQPQTTAR